MSVREFLEHRFGERIPGPDEMDAWRMAETQAFMQSPIFAKRNYFVIPNKRGDLVKLQPWSGQAMLAVCRQSQRKRGLRQFIVEVKPRQVGWTTDILGDALQEAMLPNRRVTVMVKRETVADELSHKVATMYNNLPAHMKPMKRIDNLKFLIFDNPNSVNRGTNPGLNSTFSITLPDAMRGRTPHLVVASEYAFWSEDEQSDFNSGLLAAMPLDDSACIYIDTTPNGHDESYEPMVLEAVENNPKWVKSWENPMTPTADEILQGALGEPDHPERGMVPAFWPWWRHEEYTTRNDNQRGELRALTEKQVAEMNDTCGRVDKYGGAEESELRDRFQLSPYRLWWRRRKIDSYKMPDQRLRLLTFRQECASTWDSCFIEYEDSPFDPVCLDELRRQIREPSARGLLRRDGDGIYVDQTWHSSYEEVRFYGGPTGTDRYVIGMDTAIAYENPESDQSVAVVLRVRDAKVMAVYVARVPEYRLREQLKLLYEMYNNAYYAVETAGAGYALVRSCIDIGMSNVYYWKRLDRGDPEESKFPGWQTDPRSRNNMEAALIERISRRDRDGNPELTLNIPDREMVRQIEGLRRTPTGALKSPRGLDDHADALMIALMVLQDAFLPYQKHAKEKREREELNALFMKYNGAQNDRNHPKFEDL